MLQGRRVYSDDDIAEIMGDALSAFGMLEEKYGIPEDLREETFRCCHMLVSTREVTGPLVAPPTMHIPGERLH